MKFMYVNKVYLLFLNTYKIIFFC